MRRRKAKLTIQEPIAQTLSEFELGLQYNFYRINFNEKQAKEFLLQYVSCEQKRKIIRKVNYLKLSCCWMARMLTNENKIPQKCVESLDSYIENIDKEYIKEKQPQLKIESVVDKVDRTLNEAYGYMEDAIDVLFDTKGKNASVLSAKGMIAMYGLNKKQCKYLAEKIISEHIEYLNLIDKDEDVKEAYSFISKRQQKNIHKELMRLHNELDEASQHKERKRSKRKNNRTPEEKASVLKFKPKAFVCSSVDLKDLIGKTVMFIASDDKRALYRLVSKKGFDTRSSFITNIDSAERIISYGRGLEDCVKFVCSTKNTASLNNLEKHVRVSRRETVELKNNEYRSTDKFCVIKVY